MEMNKKSASPKNNCGYCKQDSIVFVDKWVNCLFVCLSQALYGGGMILAIWGFVRIWTKTGLFCGQKAK